MNRSWSSAGQVSQRKDDRTETLNPLVDVDHDDGSEDDETKGDFDSSIHLPRPFQLLLVCRRFADASIPSLWRNLVFHGQDTYQMQSLISTLSMDDGLSDHQTDKRQSPYGLGKVGELNEEMEYSDGEGGGEIGQVSQVQDTTESYAGVANNGPAGGPAHQSDDRPNQRQPAEEYGAKSSWIETWKQFRFQGSSTGSHKSNKIEISPKPSGYPWTSAAGADGGDRTRASRIRSSSLSSPSSHMKRHQPRWSYQRYVRRVVLNFAHPQASPQMFVKVLECLQRCCPNQIIALDVHANEKMRSTGSERPEELERLFGSGFSKLRYLRLQGGFVDNQLLYALIKGLSSPNLTSSSASGSSGFETPEYSIPPAHSMTPCRLSQVFLGPGSVTDSAVEKLIAAAGHSLEVFAVTSCVDVGGGALADLLTQCPKLRVIGFHRSLARDRELLEGLGIEVGVPGTSHLSFHSNDQTVQGISSTFGTVENQPGPPPPRIIRKKIVAPLERLELGMVKLTRIGIAEILKGTCSTLRFLALEKQHFSEEFLTEVITPFCPQLEGLYFDDPKHLQRQQQQMQGLGFSAGRRGAHLPNCRFEFGRARRTFYSDPSRTTQRKPSPQPQPQQQEQHSTNRSFGKEFLERRQGSVRFKAQSKVSAWLGETSTEEWVEYGDCALWTNAASPSVSFENGGPNSGTGHGTMAYQHPRRQPLPLHHVYHNPMFMASTSTARFNPHNPNNNDIGADQHHHHYQYNSFLGEYDDVLEGNRVARTTIENVLQTLQHLVAFTVMQLDFIQESQGLSELRTMMRQDEAWVQSAGFRALKLFYVCLFLSTIYFGTLRW